MDTNFNIRQINDQISAQSSVLGLIRQGVEQRIVGQQHLVDSLLVALLCNGHVLLEGVPGLAKTLAINTLAHVVDARFSRIQFTPDLLPSDVTGTLIYSAKKEEFEVKKGPIFANFVLMLFSRPFSRLFQKLHLVGPLIRITGLIVSAVAVQMILDGAGEWLAGRIG